MVEWSCTKERLNERGPYIFVEWWCANKRNKSVGTINSGRMVVHIAAAKVPGMRRASHRPFFMGNCPTISHAFSVLSSQWMTSL